MFARARYKYPAPENGSWQKKREPLDLSDVPITLPPIPSDTSGSASRFKGVSKDKSGKKWQAEIQIASEGGKVYLGTVESEEEAGIMFARARYKYPVERSASMSPERSAAEHHSIDASDTAVVASDTSNTACMICGLSSDSFVVLLCDGCDNEAHLACAGLRHVPAGEWFCSSCRPRCQDQKKAAHSQTASSKAASHSRDTRREGGEIDEIDGIMIEAFADEDSECQRSPLSDERCQYEDTSQSQAQPPARSGQRKRSRPRSQPRSRKASRSRSKAESQPRPFRHQLLFSDARLDDEDSTSNSSATRIW